MEEVTQEVHNGQYKVLTSPKRFIVAAAGIQGGKTYVGSIWAYQEMQSNPTGAGLIIAPTYDQVVQSTLTKFFSMFPSLEKYYRKREKIMYLPTGGKVFVRSADEIKHVEGLTLKWIWGDEADGFNFETWLVLRGRVSATAGKILLTSSLYSNSWMSRELITKEGMSRYVDIVSWRSIDNPAFPRSEWELLKKTTDPVLFSRMYEAKPTFAEGLIYPYFDESRDIVTPPKTIDIVRRIAGIDFGMIDNASVCVIDVTKSYFCISDELYKPGLDFTDIKDFLDIKNKEKKISFICSDPSQKTVSAELSRHFTTSDNKIRDIHAGIYIIRGLQANGKLRFCTRAKNHLYELHHYSWRKSSLSFIEEPEDQYNDAMDSMRYPLVNYSMMYPSAFKETLDNGSKKDVNSIPEFWRRRHEARKKGDYLKSYF